MSLRLRLGLGPLVLVAVALPFFVHGACGSNADDVGTGGASGGGAGGAMGGAGGGQDPDAEDPMGEEVPVSVCPKDPIVKLAGTGAENSASQPAIAWAGAGYFIVWGDAREGGSIYGAMVDAKGKRVAGNAEDILIANTPGIDGSPEVLAVPGDGAGFLIAFEQCSAAGNCSVDTIAVGSDGKPAAGVMAQTISPAVNVQRRPYLAAGHGKIYITYRDRVGPTTKPVARVAMLEPTGAQMGAGVLVDMDSGQYPHIAVSANGVAKVAVVFQREKATEEIVLTQYDPDLVNPVEVLVRTGIPDEATNPVVQWNTNAWLVAWEDSRAGDLPQIYAATVDDATQTVGQHRPAYDENGNWPTIASGGRNTSLVGFYGYPGQRVFLSRINADTGLRPGQVVLDSGKFPAVAYNPVSQQDEYAVVYENDKARNVMFGTFTCASAQ